MLLTLEDAMLQSTTALRNHDGYRTSLLCLRCERSDVYSWAKCTKICCHIICQLIPCETLGVASSFHASSICGWSWLSVSSRRQRAVLEGWEGPPLVQRCTKICWRDK